MLKKRLVGVITIKDGRAVQSFGFRRYLPLGKPECLAENLDRWGADEIMVLAIDRSRKDLGPDLELLRRLGTLGLSTPLTYGGGVHTVQQAIEVIQAGADRLCVDALLQDNPTKIREIAALVGAQAVIGSLPLSTDGRSFNFYDYRTRSSRPLGIDNLSLFREGVISEALVIDWQHEGFAQAFDLNLVSRFPMPDIPVIAFGGISSAGQLRALLGYSNVVATAIGNSLNYSECAINHLKRDLLDAPVRPGLFASKASR